MEKFYGFEPVFDGNSRVLVLGSFPSVKSRETQFYYGNKQNRFWRVLCQAFGEPLPITVEDKKKLCLKCGIALWDIVESCEIKGSLDSNIKNYTTVDLSVVLDNSRIDKILCNGAKAYKLTKSAYKGDLPVHKMPSTSPANVRFDESVWLSHLLNE